jgi:3'-phosphoadenosine 5'-phosphosulfate sulfotransferase (PAPS reductase)/FAD synthetase
VKKLPVIPETGLPIPYSPRNFPKPTDAADNEIRLLSLEEYDHLVVSFSGGKDSIACALYLRELCIERGIDLDKIELWHQSVDGEPGKAERFWDWPCTESYCEAFAKAFGFKLLFQWKDGGYLGELLKVNAPTASSTFQLVDGGTMTAGGEDKRMGTRMAFPAMGSDLSSRWCSAYVKIDVAKKVFTTDPRFKGTKLQPTKTLILTGERRQESTNRLKYADVEDYDSAPVRGGRIVHQWRAILGWFEQDVWDIMEKYRVRPHPAYLLGWSRVSCLPCIFGEPDQWASVKELTPKVFERMSEMELEFKQAAKDLPDHPQSLQNQERRYEKEIERDKNRHALAYKLFDAGYSDDRVLEAFYEQKLAGRPKKPPKKPPKFVTNLRLNWKDRKPFTPAPFVFEEFRGTLRAEESLPVAASKGTSYIEPEMRSDVKLGMSEHYNQSVILKEGEKWKMPPGAFKHMGGPT